MKSELIYRDICRGYSEINWNGPIWIKHLDVLEQSSLQETYDAALQKAKNLGTKTEDEITKELIAAGSWTALKDTSIKSCEDDISQLESSKRKIKDYHQINGIYNAIEELKKKRIDLLTEKFSLIKNTAEAFAAQAMREEQILLTCFRNAALTERKFDEDFEYLDSTKFYNIYNNYYNLMGAFGGDELKNLCINPFFWTLFTLSENPFDFFGIPLSKLTVNQANLLRYAGNYAKIASETTDLPTEFEGNPDKMVMYWYWKKNGGEAPKEDGGGEMAKFRQLHNSQK